MKPPSPLTASLAGMGAIVAAAFHALGLLMFWMDARIFKFTLDQPPVIIGLVLQLLSVLVLGIGGAMLIARAAAGRFLVPLGALLVVLQLVLAIGQAAPFFSRQLLFHVGYLSDWALGVVLCALVAAVLAILPSTGAYIATKKPKQQPGFPPPGFPPPGNPQSGYGPPRQW
ncbi:hypothetical protein Lesp02_77220 [Lentzea sp. NBRC 105346]|uniref:hypothetical protein n=1 Tax=Lentzea sp. NBRC 105346 TaxID=3032205 RepID=UPI0024A55BFC|nr:hypothetical protein [Lentzea sp. NBRC 105346]GLZ35535.1 hypothetical protein Lesp02_77220 [Lentzea sp. NBRC 105346]